MQAQQHQLGRTACTLLILLLTVHVSSAVPLRGLRDASHFSPLNTTLVAWYAEQYKRYNVTGRILRRPTVGGAASTESPRGPGADLISTECSALQHQQQRVHPAVNVSVASTASSTWRPKAAAVPVPVPVPGHSLRYNFSIPLTRRLAGLSYVGHAARLRLLLQRIRQGEAVVVGGLGGSITAGQGVGLHWSRGWLGHLATWLNAALPPRPAATRALCGSNNGSNVTPAAGRAEVAGGATAAASLDGVTSRGRGRGRGRPPLTRHVVHSGAVPGTQSSYVSACLAQHLPPAPDLVLLEFAVNDPPQPSPGYTDPSRRAFERLLRKLLRLPSAPAVVLVNMFAHNAPAPDGSGCCKFWNNAERDFNELAAHYGLPAVSLKAAVWAHTAANASGSEALAAGAVFNAGRYHPGPGGHVVAFELLLTLLQELAAADSRMAHALTRQRLQALQHASAAAGAGGTGSSGGSAEQQHQTQQHAAHAAAEAELRAEFEAEAARPLPPPLGDENWEPGGGSSCIIQHEFQALVVAGSGRGQGAAQQRVEGMQGSAADTATAAAAGAVAGAPEGWEWTDEGRGKWGFVSTQAGRQLRIRVRTELDGPRRDRGDVVAQLVYLRGYDGMGAAELTCESGCTCGRAEGGEGAGGGGAEGDGGGGGQAAAQADAATAANASSPSSPSSPSCPSAWRLLVDGYSGERQVTVAATADFTVSQAPECVLLLTTLGPQRQQQGQQEHQFGSPGSKFKVMGILLGEDPAAAAAAAAVRAGGRRGSGSGGGMVDSFLRPDSLVSAEGALNATLQAAEGGGG